MARKLSVTAAEREFLGRLDAFVFGNPFSTPRENLLAELIPGVPLQTLRKDPEALSRVVEDRMTRFDRGGPARIQEFPAPDQRGVETAYLYLAYHRCLPDFDRLIERQLASATNPEVPFATPLLAELVERGIGDDEAVRYLAFFYQLRRAYYFIGRSLAGECASMRQLRLALWNSVFTHDMRAYTAHLWNRLEDFSTLLLGETGTGKGSAAAAIGRSAFIPFVREQRRFAANFTQSFIALNLSQFPETLIESELFGHRKGAFTGAIGNHEGVLELCSAHGALFLDEIGEVGVPIQIKLLQVLQERAFTPLGAHTLKRFHGRVIAATNRPLAELRRGRGLRDDFYYRLCSDVIVLPPLRQRIEESRSELDLLAGLLVTRMMGADDAVSTERVLAVLQRELPVSYPWPGNVRELEQAVRRILLTGHYAGDRPPPALDADEALVQEMRSGMIGAEEMLQGYCAMLYRRHGTYEEVARRAKLDRRTARKYVQAGAKPIS
jgi:sigma-54 dependent transcriptional regulator, flagellar regulatory protein